jgi:Glyoxalase-like domain
MDLHIDHVIYATGDADATAARIYDEHGLASVAGGQHPAWGTANRIVPLGGAYLELMTIFDPELGATNELGRLVMANIDAGGGFIGWMVNGAAFDDRVAANGLVANSFSREKPDGTELTWRLAGLQNMLAEPPLPGLLAWDDPASFPGLTPIEHRVKPTGIAWIELAGDEELVRSYLGGADLPLRFVDGQPGVKRAAVSLDGGGEIVLD